jgi:hypothetical protein
MGSPNAIPYEVIAAPFKVYHAPVGESFPVVDLTTPGGNWALVGTSGDLSYMDDGVKVSMSQKTTLWRSAGDVGVRKVFRTEEDLVIGLTLADMTLEQLKHALNFNSVTTAAAGSGTAGYKKIGLSRGSSVSQRALLIRGASPYGDDMTLQFEIPIAFQTGEPSIVLGKKGDPAGLALEWTAIIDPNASSVDERYGRLRAQHQVAL